MATENILEAFERVEDTLSRVERILCGDPRERLPGLMTEFEGLRGDVQGLRRDVQQLQAQRPQVLLWIAGYVCFLLSGLFAAIAVYQVSASLELYGLLDIPLWLASGLALLFAAIAAGLFVGGFGWLYGWA
jgi:hypothetical protein